jgi:hypothetical protein
VTEAHNQQASVGNYEWVDDVNVHANQTKDLYNELAKIIKKLLLETEPALGVTDELLQSELVQKKDNNDSNGDDTYDILRDFVFPVGHLCQAREDRQVYWQGSKRTRSPVQVRKRRLQTQVVEAPTRPLLPTNAATILPITAESVENNESNQGSRESSAHSNTPVMEQSLSEERARLATFGLMEVPAGIWVFKLAEAGFYRADPDGSTIR